MTHGASARSIDAVDPTRDARLPFIPTGRGAPLHVERAEGSTLFTRDGRRILDAAGGAILVNVGHGRREVADAYAQAAAETSYVVPPFATESRLRLVERLRERWLPEPLTRAYFTSGGSEAMDAATLLARQHHVSAGRSQRWKVVGRSLSYHGTTIATLSIGGQERRRAGYEPLLTGQPKAPACFCTRCPMEKTYPGCQVACADEVERVIFRHLRSGETVPVSRSSGSGRLLAAVIAAAAGVRHRVYVPRLAARSGECLSCEYYGLCVGEHDVLDTLDATLLAEIGMDGRERKLTGRDRGE